MNGIGNGLSTHYTGPIVINYDSATDFDGMPDISITTTNYTLRPTTNEQAVVTFYEDHIFGNTNTMSNDLSRRLSAHEEVKDKVDSFVNRWRSGDCYSSFVVYDSISMLPLAHTVLDHGSANGESEYSLLMRSEVPPKLTIRDGGVPSYASRLIRTSSCGSTGLEADYFDVHVNKAELANEITYAMFQGWAPWLVSHKRPVMNYTTGTAHTLLTINGTVVRDSDTFKTLEKMLERSGTNRMDSYSTSMGGIEWTHFFTTVREMQLMRATLNDSGSTTSSLTGSPTLPPNLSGTEDGLHRISLNGSQGEGSPSSDPEIFRMED